MTGFGSESSTHTELSGWPNRQPRLVLRLRSFRWEDEPLQKAQATKERLLFKGFSGRSGDATKTSLLSYDGFFESKHLRADRPAGGGCASVGRGFRMNWHCLYACSCSICRTTCLSTGDAAASLPSPP